MLWDLQSDQSAIATLCKTAQPKISSIRAPFSATASRQSAKQGRRASGEEPCLLFPSCIFDRQHGQVSNAMASTLVTRNQFNITPQGIVHKPTEAAFIPHPGDPHSGIVRLGQLGNQPRNGNHYEPEDVQRMMRELWDEFVAKNPDMFKT
jgi:hypothetical protein